MLLFDSTTTLPGRVGSDKASMMCWLVAGKSKRSDQRNLGLSVLTGVHPMVRDQDSTGSISTTDLLPGAVPAFARHRTAYRRISTSSTQALSSATAIDSTTGGFAHPSRPVCSQSCSTVLRG